jgi:hypothetical protein
MKNEILYQMNVKNTFLQGDLKEKVYMTLPSDHKRENSNLACRLKKINLWVEAISTRIVCQT